MSLEWVSGGVLSVVIHLLSLITHYSSLYPRPYRSNFARIHPCEAEALLAEVFD